MTLAPPSWRTTEFIHRRGDRSVQPLANSVTIGTIYYVVDEGITEISDGTNWLVYSGSGSRTSNLVNYTFSNVQAAPPGAQQVRFNATFPYTAVTKVWFDDLTADGQDITFGLKRIVIGSLIYIQDKNDDTQWVQFLTTANSVPIAGYVEFTVIHVDHGNSIGGGQLVLCQTQSGPTPGIDHHVTHEDGGSDEVDVKLLGGYPGGTTNFLRADATFATPPAAGSDTQVQFNDGGVLGADAGLVYNKTTDALTVAGMLTLPVGDIILGIEPSIIHLDTSDGSDTKSLQLTGGGAFGSTRGARIRLFGNEHASAPGDVNVSPGESGRINLLITSGVSAAIQINGSTGVVSLTLGQLQFPATQNPSSDPNTLDDYEEGTWTPVDVSGAGLSFSDASGTYLKIGRRVWFEFVLRFPATANGSNIAISLPIAGCDRQVAASEGYPGSNRGWITEGLGADQLNTLIATVYQTNASLSNSFLLVAGDYRVAS